MRLKRLAVLILALLLLAGCGTQTAQADTGRVYYLNFKPEQDAAWKALAESYTRQTGIPVSVVTAASGAYESTLENEMAKTNAPTLFQVNGPVGLEEWKDSCYDLAGTGIVDALTREDFALRDGEAVLGIGYVIESYGIIVNKPLLARAGYTVDEIRGFADLKRIAEDITARREELGFAAFTSAGMDASSDWRFKTHLANLPLWYEYRDGGMDAADVIEGTYLDRYQAVWDLYIHNAVCSPKELAAKTIEDSRGEFLRREAAFYQNGSWEYGSLTEDGSFSDESLAMIPLYIGAAGEEQQGLCTGTENYWCVNKNAREEDIRATIDFITWCVTSEEGTTAMAEEMDFAIPFRNAKPTRNLFIRQDEEWTAAGKTPVGWSFATIPSEGWKNGVGAALTAYAAGKSGWEAVEDAFVSGWNESKEYGV